MKKAIVIIARNEKGWPARTIEGFRASIPDAAIIAVDDGGENDFTGADHVLKGRLWGVGRARRKGAEKAIELGCGLVMLSDAHVFYDSGDIGRAWSLAQSGLIVNPSYKSHQTGEIKGCGRVYDIRTHKCERCDAEEGREVSLYGSVYFMRTETAMDILAPTPAHGANEQIMSCAAWSMGHRIHALPSLVFRHLHKTGFNYRIHRCNQMRNRKLLRWWFFDGEPPEGGLSADEIEYSERLVEKRVLDAEGLSRRIESVNSKIRSHSWAEAG